MAAYYNELDPFAAAWLRELIKAGQIADGTVDERSIADVRPDDLRGFSQCHFFAGIGGWSLALRYAGWPDERHVWTGSCPCQPFSVAGRHLGRADDRHLWPEFYRLIRQCRPSVVFGEQVAKRAGGEWFDGIRADLEAVDFAVGGADLCAAGVGAPHIRQRLYWVADADQARWLHGAQGAPRSECDRLGPPSVGRWFGNGFGDGEPRRFADGSTRRTLPGVDILVDGFPGRVESVGAIGNAIVPQVAAAFIESYIECLA